VQRQVVAGDLGRAADADAVAKPGGRHLVGLVHDGGARRHRFIGNRHGQRVTLDRIDRQRKAEIAGEARRVAAERQHVGIGSEAAAIGFDAGNGVTGFLDGADGGAEVERDAPLRGDPGHALGKHLAIAGIVIGQAQAANERHGGGREARLGGDATLGVEHLVAHAILLQHGDVVAGMVELLLLPEQLQRPLLAAIES